MNKTRPDMFVIVLKLFNENLFSIFDMGPLIDFRLTIQ